LKFRDLIKLLTSLINQIKGLDWRIDKFSDLIELEINLINPIKGLIGELTSFRLN
jgi:hypothetical protein